ncbi:MAG: 3-oxo-5-alpha-steroid 4-dehydrogenase [Deltaproteobacteria bacterium]|nr:3-oxo-5-alpha-steroid 4-dehydrogenase [Deltaproteobacteria bacterium]
MTWYTGDATYDTLLAIGLGFAALVGVAAWFVPSPYGRFSSGRFGLRTDPRLGWILMELPATVTFVAVYFSGARWDEPARLLFLAVWLVHYANRGFAFPLRMRVPKGQPGSFGAMVVGFGWFSTALHGYLNAAFIAGLAPHLAVAWLADPRFLVGIALYYASYVMNIRSDGIVRDLRTADEVARGEKTYRVPQGGLFRYVTNASYLTELTAWLGFAIATWSLAGVFILALSAANLVPRAVATHRWYRERFPDYPAGRKVLIPFVW